MFVRRVLKTDLPVVAALILGGYALYFSSLWVPWYLDDILHIVNNSAIRDLDAALSNLLDSRGLALFTFALNYRIGELSTFGYHLVNTAIHIAASVTAFSIFRLFFRDSRLIPALAALIFLAHPVQTQAVTYVVQRMTSLAGLFYLLALLFYLRFRGLERGEGETGGRPVQLAISLFFAALGALTKENVATLPVLLLAIELVLCPGKERGPARFKYLLPFLLVPALLLLQKLVLDPSLLSQKNTYYFYLENPDGSSSFVFTETGKLRDRLLFTQFIVIWKYVLLFFFPAGQTLDYAYPVVAKLLNARSLAGLVGIVAALGLAWRMRRRQPMIALGILWFFITLSIEASVFPLDPLFEHRLYVPAFGLILATVELLRQLLPGKALVGLLGAALLVCSGLTVQRNRLWADPIAFWADNVEKAPHNFRSRSYLAQALEQSGRLPEALEHQREVVRMVPSPVNYINLGRYLLKLGDTAGALSVYKMLMEANPGKALHYVNYSIALGMAGDYATSLVYAQKALALAPRDENALLQLGTARAQVGDRSGAEAAWRQVLALNPYSRKAVAKLAALRAASGVR